MMGKYIINFFLKNILNMKFDIKYYTKYIFIIFKNNNFYH